MAYQNISYQKNKNLIHVWDDKKGHLQFPFKKYAYKRSSNGRQVALDGTKVDKVTEWDEADIQRGLIYESDINPETRTLIDLYYESDDASVGHRELFFDIEVSTEGGFSSAEEAWQPLTSIAFYDKAGDQKVVIIVDKEQLLSSQNKEGVILESVQTEFELISTFLRYYLEIRPTILTGWNIDYYDVPYLYNRIKKVAGDQYANSLSPINEVLYLKHRQRYRIQGVSCLDYMALYKLFTYSEEVSYSLEAISQKELGRGKVQYEGTLDHLYKTDPEKFIEYNLTDVELVSSLDEKLKFLTLARSICHKGHVPYEDVYFTTRYLDGACITYMKRLGIVAPNRKLRDHSQTSEEEAASNEFAGAFVKDPIPGVYEWVFDEDLASLYPSIIRSLNISPETKIGRIENWDDVKNDFWTDGYSSTKCKLKSGSKHELIPVMEFRQWLLDNKYTVSMIGVIYDNSKPGLIPSILETWMNEREENRALAKKYGKEGNKKLAEFFDSRQHTNKIVNNSLYGALGAPGFRFHDLDNAESITLSGQAVTKHAMHKGNEWFSKQTGVEKDYVIYVDTDSNYYSAKPIIELMESKLNKELTYNEKIDITYKTSQIVEKYINDSWSAFAKHYMNSDVHFFNIKQEYVAESGLWIAKKRYAQKIISEKGVLISDLTKGAKQWKLDVKGMDVIRSNFPKAFREFMSEILIDILNISEKKKIDDKVLAFREDMKQKPMFDIMFPTGVKELKKYKTKKAKGQMFGDRIKGTPVHVKSALNYNDLMEYFKVTASRPIAEGEKIKWTYLKNNPFGIESCAVKGFEDDDRIIKFITQYIDYEKIFTASLENKLTDFYNALNWGAVTKNDNLSNFFEF
jgi:DNA polymerase elongation subunit (family B)